MKYIALILGLIMPVTLLSCAKAEAQLGANLRYEKDDDGNERWYDSKGYLIHYKDSDGYEWWYEYDSNGHEIHHKESS
ncbi:MAG: hypothetical protein II114_07930, partial [Treponema sp.]|nr:hypothetical protein [Treponema sp.]